MTYEFPVEYRAGRNEPFYPVVDDESRELYARYEAAANELDARVLFAGRLGDFRYYDMHQAVARALVLAEKVEGRTTAAGGRRSLTARLLRRLDLRFFSSKPASTASTAEPLDAAADALAWRSSSHTSSRCTLSDFGAWMPTRTESPRMSRIEMTMSSPTMTFSPIRRVRISTGEV